MLVQLIQELEEWNKNNNGGLCINDIGNDIFRVEHNSNILLLKKSASNEILFDSIINDDEWVSFVKPHNYSFIKDILTRLKLLN